MEACREVGIDDLIEQLPHGLHTLVHERGSSLSSGERQLIALARAFLARPRVILLDEATSSIDTETEQIIQNALKTLLKDRTSFVIAHRLSTIVNADQILVMHQGEIIERGRHQELLQHGGIYYNLYKIGFQEPKE